MALSFSFVQSGVSSQTPEQTLLITVYELGHIVEYYHKACVYGQHGYYCLDNQRREMADLISMCRMYCEQRGWSFEELMGLGEEAYLERMADIRTHGRKKEDGNELGSNRS